jgi:hypothetical protein
VTPVERLAEATARAVLMLVRLHGQTYERSQEGLELKAALDAFDMDQAYRRAIREDEDRAFIEDMNRRIEAVTGVL